MRESNREREAEKQERVAERVGEGEGGESAEGAGQSREGRLSLVSAQGQ